jgi:hypothetical protein
VPRPCVLCKGGWQWRLYDEYVMPSGLHRTYGALHLHFILDEAGPVRVNEGWSKISFRAPAA